jgi:hypothetical protein
MFNSRPETLGVMGNGGSTAPPLKYFSAFRVSAQYKCPLQLELDGYHLDKDLLDEPSFS